MTRILDKITSLNKFNEFCVYFCEIERLLEQVWKLNVERYGKKNELRHVFLFLEQSTQQRKSTQPFYRCVNTFHILDWEKRNVIFCQ